MRAPANTNDGRGGPPRLLAGISFLTFDDLPKWSAGPHGDHAATHAALAPAGYEAVQTLWPERAHAAGLIPTGLARVIDDPASLADIAARFRDAGCDCTTVQLGDGLESEAGMDRLAEALLEASEKQSHPLYLETHRATMTQDIRRAVDLVGRFPELRFNGDFGHWYIGHELTYGDMERKFAAMAPVFERTRFLHLRVSSNVHGQLTASDPREARHLAFHARMWTAAFEGFLASAAPGDYIAAHTELLPARSFYPIMVNGEDGEPREESDRWTQSAFLINIAQDCFAEAATKAKAHS
ncbi:MAG TPA: hypothetical protein VGL73_07865 [Caulobacteraceae bacterium]